MVLDGRYDSPAAASSCSNHPRFIAKNGNGFVEAAAFGRRPSHLALHQNSSTWLAPSLVVVIGWCQTHRALLTSEHQWVGRMLCMWQPWLVATKGKFKQYLYIDYIDIYSHIDMLVSGDVGKVALSTAPMVYHPVYLSEIVDMHAPWLCETSEVRMLGMVCFSVHHPLNRSDG